MPSPVTIQQVSKIGGHLTAALGSLQAHCLTPVGGVLLLYTWV